MLTNFPYFVLPVANLRGYPGESDSPHNCEIMDELAVAENSLRDKRYLDDMVLVEASLMSWLTWPGQNKLAFSSSFFSQAREGATPLSYSSYFYCLNIV